MRILAEFLQRRCGLLTVLVRISLGLGKLDCSQLGPCGLIQHDAPLGRTSVMLSAACAGARGEVTADQGRHQDPVHHSQP